MHVSRLLVAPSLLATALCLPGTAAAQWHGSFSPFGAVYTLSNDAADNSVEVALRLPNGALWPLASYATSGQGTGAGLGSQSALALSSDDRWLLAVDPGSDQVTLFRTFAGGLFLWRRDTDPSGGDRPTSVALHGDVAYVLNAGSDSIRGFRVGGWQGLQPIAGANYALSQTGAAAAQVGFSPDGDWLVVTERATDRIGVFPVHGNGTLGAPVFSTSAGQTPFGFLFRDDGTLVVSEAVGGAADASVVSTYRIAPDGTLQTITAAAATTETAACWIAIPKNGKFAYTTNTGSGTLSGFSLAPNGAATLLDADGVTADLGAGAAPLDAEFTPNGKLLYVLDAGNDEVRAFRRLGNGALLPLGTMWSLDDGAAGLLAR